MKHQPGGASMKTLEMIETELAGLRKQLDEVRGTETEVYTRIVGYYRSLRNWNKGKREEYDHRLTFAPASAGAETAAPDRVETRVEDPVPRDGVQGSLFGEAGAIAGYSYFYRKTCPNCTPVQDFVSRLPLEGNRVDVDTEDGYSQAAAWGVMSTPTVVFFDADGRPVRRYHSVDQMEGLFAAGAV